MKFRKLLLLAVLIASSMLAFGQASSTGTILGRVEDSGGAAIVGAKVTILNIATGIDHVIVTNQDGEYTAPGLQPGSYKVTIEFSGFGSKVSTVGLVVAQQERVDATLKLGGAVETVTVEASGGAQLDTDSATIAQLVSEKQVNQLPLNGRNFLNLLFIGAGAVQTVGEQGQMRGGEGNAISISGARPESNNYTLDGIVNTDTALNTPAVILSQDAIQEFKVQSETYSAEFGFSANQVNIVSKSGTNQLHGSVFEFNRNDALDASTHFQPQKPVLRQNQFGFVLGGPVYIPKIYNGRDKTFFLANYEGARIKAGTSPVNQFVPDPAQLGGNFANPGLIAVGTVADSGGTCSAALSAGNPCLPIDPLTGQPFPGNVIPTSRFSNLAKVAIGAGLFPAPNEAGVANGYILQTVLADSTDQQTYRLDQNLKKYGSVFGRYTRAQYLNNSAGTVSVPFGVNVFTENSVSWQINHTISLGQNNVNNFRYGNLSAKSIQGANPASTSDVAALGLSGIFTNLPAYARGYPNISIGGFNGTTEGSPGNDPTTSDIPQWEIADSFTSIHGRHTLSLGFDFRSWIQKRNLSSNFLGSYSYASATVLTNGGTAEGAKQNTTNPCTTAYCGTGNATADFLLGYYSGASTFQPGPFSTGTTPGNLNQFHFKYFAPYIQDDWKVTSNLTLNLGLRYDFRTIPTETDNKMFWIDKANTQGGLCFANQKLLTDGIAPAGNGFYRYCGRNNPRDAAKVPFAPRLGFAYRPFGDNKTVIRGGYGLYFDSTETREIDDSGDLYPYVIRTSINPVTASGTPKVTDNLFPATAAPHAVSVATDGGQFIAVIISENPINPYVQQYTLSVQRELAPNTTLEVNYIGNKGTHLLDRVNINEPLPIAAADLAKCQVNDPSCNPALRRPLPNFTNTTGTLDSHWTGYSNYNAGNVKFERRSTDLAAVLVYTYSKSMDDKSAAAGIGATNGFAGHLDDRNPSRDYARSDFDVGQRFVASFVYNLPFGQGKKFVNKVNKAADLAVGGWELTSIATFQKGFPFSVLGNDLYGLLSAYNQRANINGPANSGFSKSLNKWFNTASFSQPLAGVFGSSGRNILRDPGINNFDIGLLKNFAVYDRVNLQLRMETFNTFNHAQYGVDPSTPTAAASGPGTGAVDRNVNDVGSATNANFGQVISARPGRVLQLGAKITF